MFCISSVLSISVIVFFFFNDTATTEIYTLSLHDALPISGCDALVAWCSQLIDRGYRGEMECTVAKIFGSEAQKHAAIELFMKDRKSTRLNSSHANISYAVFCLKKKKTSSQHILLNTTQQR